MSASSASGTQASCSVGFATLFDVEMEAAIAVRCVSSDRNLSENSDAGIGPDGGTVRLISYRGETIGVLSRDWVSALSRILPAECGGPRPLPAGIKVLVACEGAFSASGNADPGDYVIVTDHVNASGYNPLIGCSGCFPDVSGAYPARYRELAHRVAAHLGRTPREAVLVSCPDPMEPPAWLRALNGCVFGSALPAVTLAAARDSVPTLALALITGRARIGRPTPDDSGQEAEGVREFIRFALECAASISEKLK